MGAVTCNGRLRLVPVDLGVSRSILPTGRILYMISYQAAPSSENDSFRTGI